MRQYFTTSLSGVTLFAGRPIRAFSPVLLAHGRLSLLAPVLGSAFASARPAGAGSSRKRASAPAQPCDVIRSRRLNSRSASRLAEAARCAWFTIQGSTRGESSIAIVSPYSPSPSSNPATFR